MLIHFVFCLLLFLNTNQSHWHARTYITHRMSACFRSRTRGTKLVVSIACGIISNTYWKVQSARCSSKSACVVTAVSRVKEVRRSTAHTMCWINTYQIMWNTNLQKDPVWLKIQKAQHGWSAQFSYLQFQPKLDRNDASNTNKLREK